MHLFLSPHLDDAVLSCGGTIHHLVQQGQRVQVMTIMSADPPNPLPESPLIRELHARWQIGESPVAARRAEDKAALEVLGAAITYLDMLDCVYRTANGVVLYPYGDEDIFGDVAADDPARDELRQITQIDAASHIYAPLAAGHHVDHQLVRDWVITLAESRPETEIWLYEDYPYSAKPQSIQQALNALSVAVEKQVQPLTEADYEAKVRAITQYQSQISTFWENIAQMRDEVHQTMSAGGDGVLVERYWRIRN